MESGLQDWTTILTLTLCIFLPAITAVASGFKFMSVYVLVYHQSYLQKGKTYTSILQVYNRPKLLRYQERSSSHIFPPLCVTGIYKIDPVSDQIIIFRELVPIPMYTVYFYSFIYFLITNEDGLNYQSIQNDYHSVKPVRHQVKQ